MSYGNVLDKLGGVPNPALVNPGGYGQSYQYPGTGKSPLRAASDEFKETVHNPHMRTIVIMSAIFAGVLILHWSITGKAHILNAAAIAVAGGAATEIAKSAVALQGGQLH